VFEGVVITHCNDPLFGFCHYLWRPIFLFICEVSGSDFLRNPSEVTCMRAPESRASLSYSLSCEQQHIKISTCWHCTAAAQYLNIWPTHILHTTKKEW